MDYQQAIEKIHDLKKFGDKLGLERVSTLLEKLGNPQDKLRFVHVAGTNGKGSTTAITASVLKSAGFKTGMYISPFVLEFRERMQINGEMIPENELVDCFNAVYEKWLEMEKEGGCPTEFEFITAMAFLWFYKSGCDIVCLEVGLGGRFDATNVIKNPLVSIITSISLDHTMLLGETVEEIAFEKCGIVKNMRPVVTYPDQDIDALSVIMEQTSKKNTRLVIPNANSVKDISKDIYGSVFEYDGIEITLPMWGEHQILNCITAVEAIYVLRGNGFTISDRAVVEGIKNVRFPARLEILNDKPLVILDGAHNKSGAKVLRKSLKMLKDKKIIGIMGILEDKDYYGVIEKIVPMCSGVITVTPDNPRALAGEKLCDELKQYTESVEYGGDYKSAFETAMKNADENTAIVVFGSLYLASDMRKIILNYFG